MSGEERSTPTDNDVKGRRDQDETERGKLEAGGYRLLNGSTAGTVRQLERVIQGAVDKVLHHHSQLANILGLYRPDIHGRVLLPMGPPEMEAYCQGLILGYMNEVSRVAADVGKARKLLIKKLQEHLRYFVPSDWPPRKLAYAASGPPNQRNGNTTASGCGTREQNDANDTESEEQFDESIQENSYWPPCDVELKGRANVVANLVYIHQELVGTLRLHLALVDTLKSKPRLELRSRLECLSQEVERMLTRLEEVAATLEERFPRHSAERPRAIFLSDVATEPRPTMSQILAAIFCGYAKDCSI